MLVLLWISDSVPDEKQWKYSIAAKVYLNISGRCRSVAQETNFPTENTAKQNYEQDFFPLK